MRMAIEVLYTPRHEGARHLMDEVNDRVWNIIWVAVCEWLYHGNRSDTELMIQRQGIDDLKEK